MLLDAFRTVRSRGATCIHSLSFLTDTRTNVATIECVSKRLLGSSFNRVSATETQILATESMISFSVVLSLTLAKALNVRRRTSDGILLRRVLLDQYAIRHRLTSDILIWSSSRSSLSCTTLLNLILKRCL